MGKGRERHYAPLRIPKNYGGTKEAQRKKAIKPEWGGRGGNWTTRLSTEEGGKWTTKQNKGVVGQKELFKDWPEWGRRKGGGTLLGGGR